MPKLRVHDCCEEHQNKKRNKKRPDCLSYNLKFSENSNHDSPHNVYTSFEPRLNNLTSSTVLIRPYYSTTRWVNRLTVNRLLVLYRLVVHGKIKLFQLKLDS